MNRQSFAYLLKKYLSGNATEEEKAVVEEWYGLLNEVPREFSPYEWEALENRLWNNLQLKAFGNDTASPKLFSFRRVAFIRSGIAAAVILAVVSCFIYFNDFLPQLSQKIISNPEPGFTTVINTTENAIRVPLEDGSQVWLDPGSELRFPKHFSNNIREVHLAGNAFFEVARKTDSPFLVNAGRIVAKVLGTGFWVKSNEKTLKTEVSVKTGKVAVYEAATQQERQSNKKGSGVVLSPNQRVTFFEENKLFVTALVENPMMLPVEKNTEFYDFRFDDVPLSEVLNKLSVAYNIAIETEKQPLNDCPLTANLNGKNLYAQLEIICAAIEGYYEVKGTTVLISGKGCR